jgi:predicted aspartyl protease
MSAVRISLSFALAVSCVGWQAAARADDCPQLQMVASVPMSYDAGRPIIPVTVGPAQKTMLVDTGGALSMIRQRTVDELKLSQTHVPVQVYGVAGNISDQEADAAPFAIGNLVASHMQFMVDATDADFAGDVSGIIGPNILRHYDADFDFGANKFNLMSQDHCPGRVIYWPAAGVAVVPITVAKEEGHVVVPVTVDGVKLNGLIDTGSSGTFLSSRVAESDLRLKLNTPETPDIGSLPGRPGARVYRHTFHSLALEGIAIGNLTVEIMPDLNRSVLSQGPQIGSRFSNTDEAAGLEDITIGMDVLKHLHVYIAYKEHVLYATPAGAPPAQSGAPESAQH